MSFSSVLVALAQAELALAAAAPEGRVDSCGCQQRALGTRSLDLIWRGLTVIGSRCITARDIAEVIHSTTAARRGPSGR